MHPQTHPLPLYIHHLLSSMSVANTHSFNDDDYFHSFFLLFQRKSWPKLTNYQWTHTHPGKNHHSSHTHNPNRMFFFVLFSIFTQMDSKSKATNARLFECFWNLFDACLPGYNWKKNHLQKQQQQTINDNKPLSNDNSPFRFGISQHPKENHHHHSYMIISMWYVIIIIIKFNASLFFSFHFDRFILTYMKNEKKRKTKLKKEKWMYNLFNNNNNSRSVCLCLYIWNNG